MCTRGRSHTCICVHAAQVREYWEYCGPIESLDLMTFPDTGRFRGIAFITYVTQVGLGASTHGPHPLLAGRSSAAFKVGMFD